MTRAVLALVVALTLALGAAFPSVPANAAPPHVSGQSCAALSGSANIWRATYWAETTDLFGHKRTVMNAPCFTSAARCEAWFYWAQSAWPDRIAAERCRKIG